VLRRRAAGAEARPRSADAPARAAKVPSRLAPEPKALAAAADLIAAARKPVIIAEFVGREPEGFHALVELAETGGILYTTSTADQLPTRHPLNMSMAKDVFRDADLVLCSIRATGAADHRARERHAKAHLDRVRRRQVDSTSALATSSSRAGLSTTSACTTQRCASSRYLLAIDVSALLGDRSKTLQVPGAGASASGRDSAAKRGQARKLGQGGPRADWDASPIMLPRLASEIWDADQGRGLGAHRQHARGMDAQALGFRQALRHPGARSARDAVRISLGVALAHRDKKRLVVDIQPDGDLMFDAGAMWVAAKHCIPLLVVMYNNRAYYNDWEHQIRMAKLRGTRSRARTSAWT